jgi:hypothetical protein
MTMTTALIFLPIFVGLFAALTVVAADLLSPEKKEAAGAAKSGEKRPVAA